MNKVSKRTARAGCHRGASMAADLGDLIKILSRSLFDTYRPELHYMRGPGPKWHAKHDPAPAEFDVVPAFVRVPVKG